MKHVAISLLAEGRRLFRFLSVGVAATLLHLSIAIALLALYQANPVAANGIAFLCSVAFSFWGHSRWTFRDKAATRSAHQVTSFARFFLVAALAFAMNNGALVALLKWRLLPDAVAVAVSVVVIPIVTYAANRLWVFR